jgi:hypothetical protein
VRVGEPLEGGVFGEREHVMTRLSQSGGYSSRGEVGAE